MAASFRPGPPEGDNPGSGIFGFAVKGHTIANERYDTIRGRRAVSTA